MSANFTSAKNKLLARNRHTPPYPLEDLPDNPNDDLWARIEAGYGLTIPEVGALKKHVHQQQQQQQQQQPWLSEEMKVNFELMLQDYGMKKRTIVLSSATSSAKNQMLAMLDLPERGVTWPNKPEIAVQCDGFSWLNSNEDSVENRTAYIAHLHSFLQLPNDYSLADVQPDRQLLDVELLQGMPNHRKISGTTDVVIAKSQHVQNKAIRSNIEALIELKKPKNLKSNYNSAQAQTIVEHFAASYLNSKHAVVSVVTDLNNSWTFFWFAKDEDCTDAALYRLCLENEGAAGLAKYILDSLSDTTCASRRWTLPTTFVDRLSFRAVLESVVKENNKRARRDFDGAGGGAGSSSPEQDSKPSASLGGSDVDQHPTSGSRSGGGTGGNSAMERNLASTLSLFAPPANRDVANELDLLDMVDESEQYEIVRSFAAKHIVPFMTGQYNTD